MPKPNEGTVDRVIRLILGIAVISIGFFFFDGLTKDLLLVVGIIILTTGAIGYCHLYKIIGINTLGKKKRK